MIYLKYLKYIDLIFYLSYNLNMSNILNLSKKDLLKFIKDGQDNRVLKNLNQVNHYKLQNINAKIEEEFKYEKEIVAMIKHSVSLQFISRYFNIHPDLIKNIATKHKCYSQLFTKHTENIEARCFSKTQILKACEDFNYICPMCFKPLDITNPKTLTGHHILPFAKGGKTTKDNCLPLHVSCHFEEFKILHEALFNTENLIYSAQHFEEIKKKLQEQNSGISFIFSISK